MWLAAMGAQPILYCIRLFETCRSGSAGGCACSCRQRCLLRGLEVPLCTVPCLIFLYLDLLYSAPVSAALEYLVPY